MEIKNVEVMNFQGAFRGLRNPLESWNKSDSYFGLVNIAYDDYKVDKVITAWVEQQLSKTELQEGDEPIEFGSQEYENLWEKYWNWWHSQGILKKGEDVVEVACIGPKDLDLAQRMIKAGSSDRKFLRQIMVSVDITAPLYWWKQFDTYKVATVANSTSTMHKLASTPITKECFEMDDMHDELMMYKNNPFSPDIHFSEYWTMLINDLEHLRKKYNETKNQGYWKELIRLLPESWLQTRTVTLNYQVLRNIYSQRKNHRLNEWHVFCNWIKTLPYGYELITFDID